MASNIKYDIRETLASLPGNKGWALEVNLISWNGNAPKIDIRHWSEDHEKMTKGITLTQAEAEFVAKALMNEKK